MGTAVIVMLWTAVAVAGVFALEALIHVVGRWLERRRPWEYDLSVPDGPFIGRFEPTEDDDVDLPVPEVRWMEGYWRNRNGVTEWVHAHPKRRRLPKRR